LVSRRVRPCSRSRSSSAEFSRLSRNVGDPMLLVGCGKASLDDTPWHLPSTKARSPAKHRISPRCLVARSRAGGCWANACPCISTIPGCLGSAIMEFLKRQPAQTQPLTERRDRAARPRRTTVQQLRLPSNYYCAQKIRPTYESQLQQLPRLLPKVGLHPVSVCACLVWPLAIRQSPPLAR
jgi:hypothetical protein